MNKLIIFIAIAAILAACQEPPLPAFAKADSKCRIDNCTEFQVSEFQHSYQYLQQYPDKHYDSILGHHDYSVESDH